MSRPLLGIPLPALLFIILLVLAVLLMRFTVFGRSLYAVGSNPIAARLTGIRSRRVLILSFVGSGLAAALSGMILSSQLGGGSPSAASGLELSVITAIILGGASLHGGRGTIIGTFVGLLVIAVLNNGLQLLSVGADWQSMIKGLVLLVAVAIDVYNKSQGRASIIGLMMKNFSRPSSGPGTPLQPDEVTSTRETISREA